MPDVAVVTDTTHYLPREIVAELGVGEVSLYVNDGERQEREADIADFDAFYDAPAHRARAADDLAAVDRRLPRRLRAARAPPAATSSRSTSRAAISGTVESARQARGRARPRSGSAHRGHRLQLACGGARHGHPRRRRAVARAGGDVDAVAARAREAVGATQLWFAVDTLEYLRRGGRIGAAQAWLGGALKIKPILTFEGEIAPIERVRTSGRAFERMVDYLRSRHDDGADGWVVQHIQAPDAGRAPRRRGREIFGSEPLFVSEIGPVIGAHVGPGLLGVGGIPAAARR